MVGDVGQARAGKPLARDLACVAARQAALHHGSVGDVVEHRAPREQRAVLEDHDAVAARPRRQRVAVEQDPPGGQAVEAGDRVQQRGLAAAGRADEHVQLAGLDVERAGLERDDVAVRLAGAADAQRAAHARVNRLPTARTTALVAKPTIPSVIIAITIVG